MNITLRLTSLFFIIGLVSCQDDKVMNKIPLSDKIKKVRAISPVWISYIDTIEAYGAIKTSDQLSLSFQVSGEVQKVNTKEGKRVKKGDIIGLLVDRESNIRLTKLQLEKNKIIEKLRSLQTQIDISAKNLSAYNDMLEDSLISREQVDLASLEVGTYDVQKAQLELSIKELDQDIAFVTTQQSLRSLTSPINGEIIDMRMNKGEVVNTGQVVVTIDQKNTPIILAEMSDLEVVKVSQGDKATVVLDAFPDQVIPATVYRMPYENTGAKYVVELILDKPLAKMLPGMYGKIMITTNHVVEGYSLPLNALIKAEGDKAKILTVTDGRAKEVNIDIIQLSDDLILINGPVNNDSQVLINVNGIVRSGEKVQLQAGI